MLGKCPNSRRKRLDIVVNPNKVEESVVGIFDKLGCSIDTDRIEACQKEQHGSYEVHETQRLPKSLE